MLQLHCYLCCGCSELPQNDKALFFFNTWFTDFFFQNIKVGGGKKIKVKITKKIFFLFNLKHIWIGEKNNNKNCMILHCKNAEMTITFRNDNNIVISAFLQCKIIQFFFFFKYF